MNGTRIIRFVDLVAKPLIVLSVFLYLLEEELSLRYGWSNSLESPRAFLWIERIIACLFTLEFLVRCYRAKLPNSKNRVYPFGPLGLFDFIAIFPFWLGFMVPASWLGLIRTMRILRLLKFFRYSRSLQLTFIKFYRAYHNIKGVAFSICIVWLFFAVVCLRLECQSQPENFSSLFDAVWFTIVTGTTVGYGDISPVTVAGKIFVGLMLVPVIAMIGASISAISNAFDSVQEQEDDPNVDPVELFGKEMQRMKNRKKMEREYRMEE